MSENPGLKKPCKGIKTRIHCASDNFNLKKGWFDSFETQTIEFDAELYTQRQLLEGVKSRFISTFASWDAHKTATKKILAVLNEQQGRV